MSTAVKHRWSLSLFWWGLLLLGTVPGAAVFRTARASGGKPTALVFLQLDAKSSAVERTLRERLPALGVTVFGRFRDFEEGLTNGNPDAVLTIGPVLAHRGKKATLEGIRGGKNTEPYVLVSVSQPIEGSLSGRTIGVVDLLGREGTQALLADLLRATDFKMKRVAKIEDLLPLLEFSAADAVVLPAAMLKRFVERTRLVIKTRELPRGVGLPVVAVLNPAAQDLVVKSFEELDGATRNLLGIESWVRR